MLEFKSPGEGLQPMYIGQLVGTRAKRNVLKGACFYDSDLKEVEVKPEIITSSVLLVCL